MRLRASRCMDHLPRSLLGLTQGGEAQREHTPRPNKAIEQRLRGGFATPKPLLMFGVRPLLTFH
jgi:hypothetical protein